MILNAHELKSGDVVQKPKDGWHKISKVKKTPECVRFEIDGKGYAIPADYGVRVKR